MSCCCLLPFVAASENVDTIVDVGVNAAAARLVDAAIICSLVACAAAAAHLGPVASICSLVHDSLAATSIPNKSSNDSGQLPLDK